MNVRKKLLIALSALVPFVSFALTHGDFEYDVVGSEVKITKYSGTNTVVTVPGEIDGKPVLEIGYQAFSQNRTVTQVVLPAALRRVGRYAFFGCSALESVPLPSALQSIGEYAFRDCTRIGRVTIPDSVTSLGDEAFSACSSLTNLVIGSGVTVLNRDVFARTGAMELTLPNNITEIGSSAFWQSAIRGIDIGDGVTIIRAGSFSGCSQLETLLLGDALETIEDYAFSNCTKLEEANLPLSVESISRNAFSGCSALATVTCHNGSPDFSCADGVLYDKEQSRIIICPEGRSGSYTTPATVHDIAAETFKWCAKLTDVTLDNSITNIGSYAFNGCSKLGSVALPSSLETLGKYAFYNCTALTNAVLPSGLESIGEYAFINCSKLPAISIPDSVLSVGPEAFSGCSSANSLQISSNLGSIERNTFARIGAAEVVIPNSVTNIDGSAFFNSGITSVWIGYSVRGIGSAAFSYCSNLDSVMIGHSRVETISDYAFQGCGNLQAIELPATLSSITRLAFYSCANLQAITLRGENPAYSAADGVLYDKDQTRIFCYPLARPGRYDAPSTLRQVDEYTFQRNTSITSATFSGITNIARYAFQNCRNLKSVDLPETLTTIGEYAFYGTGLESVVIPDSVTVLGAQVFSSSSLQSVFIGSGITVLPRNLFSSCIYLEDITLPDNVRDIGDSAFWGCSGLENITIGAGVTNIAANAFSYAGNLKGMYFEGMVPPAASDTLLANSPSSTVYCLDFSYGWEDVASYGGRPVEKWFRLNGIEIADAVQSPTGFSFRVYASDNHPLNIEICTNLAEGVWMPLQTRQPRYGAFDYTDLQSNSRPGCFYRVSCVEN
ncbi:MAG: leucine-rich repeat domain-containing protein [Pontiellaceae bacterium]|nr:leucine-rich repeat domain-containing protein [Pontiellaceae bacterium]MBN2785924.1 leucine-rich repeat domain-containing protein [Pontiellaceae bacterium]